jgi:hypothetical protein
VLDLVGIDQSPSHPLYEPGRKVVAFEVAWDHPLLQQDGRLASIGPIRRYENSWHREPPWVVGVTIVARGPCQRIKAE